MTKSKIPAQIYVVSKPTPEDDIRLVDGEYKRVNLKEHNFGFLHPHNPGKAGDDKRKDTQHSWAYYGSHTYQNDDGVWYQTGSDFDWRRTPHRVDFDRPIDLAHAPGCGITSLSMGL